MYQNTQKKPFHQSPTIGTDYIVTGHHWQLLAFILWQHSGRWLIEKESYCVHTHTATTRLYWHHSQFKMGLTVFIVLVQIFALPAVELPHQFDKFFATSGNDDKTLVKINQLSSKISAHWRVFAIRLYNYFDHSMMAWDYLFVTDLEITKLLSKFPEFRLFSLEVDLINHVRASHTISIINSSDSFVKHWIFLVA